MRKDIKSDSLSLFTSDIKYENFLVLDIEFW